MQSSGRHRIPTPFRRASVIAARMFALLFSQASGVWFRAAALTLSSLIGLEEDIVKSGGAGTLPGCLPPEQTGERPKKCDFSVPARRLRIKSAARVETVGSTLAADARPA